MRQRVLTRAGMVYLGTVLLMSAWTAHRPPAQRVPRPDPAAVVTRFVQTTLAMRVLLIEGTLATATRHLIGTYPHESNITLVRVLHQQTLLLRGVSHDLTSLLPPQVGTLPTIQLARLIEDLALVGEDVADVLQEAIAAVSGMPMGEEKYAGMESCVSYSPRVRHAVAILRRAEAWLKTVDHETGAHATLPGFELGAISLESVLAMP